MMIFLTIVAFMVINRIRGGLFPLPINTKLAAAALVALWAYLLQITVSAPFFVVTWHPHFIGAIVFGACWLIWAYPPWSRWMTLGFAPMTIKPPTQLEVLIEQFAFGSVGFAWYLRQLIFLIPMAVMFSAHWWVLVGLLPFSYWSAYLAGWEAYKNSSFHPEPIGLSEWIGGCFWGFAVAQAAGLL